MRVTGRVCCGGAEQLRKYEGACVSYFSLFFDAFNKSDKKTLVANLSPLFPTADVVGEFVTEPYAKLDDRAPEKW